MIDLLQVIHFILIKVEILKFLTVENFIFVIISRIHYMVFV